MKKNLLLTLFASTVILAACGDGDAASETESNAANDVDETEVTEDVTDTTENTETEEETETIDEPTSTEDSEEASSEIGKRSNPVPFEETFSIDVNIYESLESFESEPGVIDVTITNLISGEEAYDYLMEENMYNEEAPEGYQWIVIDVESTLVEGSQDNAYTPTPLVSTVSASGSESPSGHYASLNNEYGYNDLFEGGSTSGQLATIAPSDEEYLIKWSEGVIDSLFFSPE